MNQSNAAQLVLTDDELRAIQGQHLNTIGSIDKQIASVIVAGRAIEQAVLSKLRAAVAEELPHWEEISAKLERDETLTPLELFIHENEPAGSDAADAWRDQLAAALASAPVADERAIGLFREALAWGCVYGPKLKKDQWERMRDETAQQFSQRLAALISPPVDEGELRTAFNEWIDKTDFIQQRIASGALPVKYLGWHRADVMRDLIDAALASAPVAGEAQRLDAPAQVGGTRFGKGIHWSTVIMAAQSHYQYMQDPAREAERIAQAKQFQAFVAGNAAPQASTVGGQAQAPKRSDTEISRLFDQELDEIFPPLPRLSGKGAHWDAAPQTSEAVRQQRAEVVDELARLREALQFYAHGNHYHFFSDTWDTCSGEPQNFWFDEAETGMIEDGSVARAALSAQPAEEPATSAPSPAASQRQAMIPASRESGNSHTDGGAVYE